MADQPILAIAVSGAIKRYGPHEVVRGVSFSLAAGESLALLGHNGAGKTTLIKLMLGITRADGGDIRICGLRPDERAFAGLRRRVGFLPENVVFHNAMTGREILSFYARLKGAPASAVDALLDRVGLGEARNRRVRTYSKGMRQRLGLAQALLGDPVVLFLDEPTTGLDPALRRQFYEIIAERQRQGTAVLLSSHALGEVEARADRMAIMKNGRMVACGTLDELRRAAARPVRVRVAVAPGKAQAIAADLGADAEVRTVNAAVIELSCAPCDKMRLLHRLAGLDGLVRDIDIAPPGLEEIYTHFTEGAGPQ